MIDGIMSSSRQETALSSTPSKQLAEPSRFDNERFGSNEDATNGSADAFAKAERDGIERCAKLVKGNAGLSCIKEWYYRPSTREADLCRCFPNSRTIQMQLDAL
jgi:hypothetical protein